MSASEPQAWYSRYLALTVAGFVIALGITAAATPAFVIASGRDMVSPFGIYAAGALRGGIGVALLLIARGSRSPAILRAMGVVALVAGLAMPMLGVDSARARIEWEAEHTTFLRVEGVLFMWAGVIVYKLSQSPQGRNEPSSMM